MFSGTMKSHHVFPEPWNQGDGLGGKATEAGVLLFMHLLSNPESHLYKWFSQENAIHLGEWGLDIVLRGPGHCEAHSSGPAQWHFTNHIHLEEGAGGEREKSQWVQKLTFFFFLIIEVLGAIHTGYTQFQSLGSGAAVNQAMSRWDDRGLISWGWSVDSRSP